MQTPLDMEYQNTAARVVQRSGAIDDLGREVAALGCTRVLLVCGGSTRRGALYERGNKSLGSLVVGRFEKVVEHSSTVLVTEAAAIARGLKIDGIVATPRTATLLACLRFIDQPAQQAAAQAELERTE